MAQAENSNRIEKVYFPYTVLPTVYEKKSERAAPLTALTIKGMGIHKWGTEFYDAFLDLENALVSSPILFPQTGNYLSHLMWMHHRRRLEVRLHS